MSDPWAGIDPSRGEGPEATDERRCPWCSSAITADATKCSTCGAAVAQRESVGGLVIPGVTSIDPAYGGSGSALVRSTLRGQQTSAALASLAHVHQGAQIAVAGALLARDYMKGMLSGLDRADLSDVGRPSEAALLAADRLDRDGELPAGGSDVPAVDGASPEGAVGLRNRAEESDGAS